MPAIEVQDLHKSYGAHVALRGISFSVNEGEVVGFLGPNGAGKSTAMKILTGFLSPTSGIARVMGHETLNDPIEARRKIGYLPENAPIYPDMRVRDYLDYVGRVRELGRAECARAIVRVAQQCGIEDRLGQRIGALSKGYRQRVGLADRCFERPPGQRRAGVGGRRDHPGAALFETLEQHAFVGWKHIEIDFTS